MIFEECYEASLHIIQQIWKMPVNHLRTSLDFFDFKASLSKTFISTSQLKFKQCSQLVYCHKLTASFSRARETISPIHYERFSHGKAPIQVSDRM